MKIEEKMLKCQAVLKVTLLNVIVYHKVEQMLNNTDMRCLHPECISWKIQSAVFFYFIFFKRLPALGIS